MAPETKVVGDEQQSGDSPPFCAAGMLADCDTWSPCCNTRMRSKVLNLVTAQPSEPAWEYITSDQSHAAHHMIVLRPIFLEARLCYIAAALRPLHFNPLSASSSCIESKAKHH